MKNILFLLLSLLSLPALGQSTLGANISIRPATPKPGETLTIEYDWLNSPLRNATEIELVVATLTDKNPDVQGLALNNVTGRLVGTFTIPATAQAMSLAFHSGQRWDNNHGEGYFVALHGPDGKPLIENKAAQAVLYVSNGPAVFDLSPKQVVANEWLDESFRKDPALRTKYLSNYIANLMRIKRGEAGKPEALALLAELESAPKASEKDLVTAVRQYEFLQAMDKSNALKEKIRVTFPKGSFVQQERRGLVANQVDLATRETMLEEFAKDFPPQTEADRRNLDGMRSALALKWFETKDMEKFRWLAAALTPASRASLYNNVAWQMGEKQEELGWARLLSQEATEWARMEITAASQPKPGHLTQQQWLTERKEQYATYADTYAYLLDMTSEPAPAAELQAKAVEITAGHNEEMNERLCRYLERANAPDYRARLELFLAQGHATPKMKEQFKQVFLASNNNEKAYQDYVAGLEKKAKANRIKELKEDMIELPAPTFSLSNLKGETVSLEALRGKVVVLDFWATWCGPCKASFPGMQQAQSQYKQSADVVFLFVDSWERVPADQKAKTAGDFIASKNYDFNVLLDLDDRVVSAYGVSGIPTKFIVDKNGVIRFKAVGYNGSPEGLAEELSAMIELAKG
ncbi:MAG TPA: redoxin domain-containing protein [Saprospiraceae bacterium]|nr:redoxin domain-containing protein [Saprospiraceae bacterium]